ncbi:MAG: cation diffusion facilitator family transporter [Acidimicrobiales bacterium]|jgi:cobalt-zinc-cadmium efflux system protein|nr:cation diffusion facilitator family transporter [Actinomycetota bacterium]
MDKVFRRDEHQHRGGHSHVVSSGSDVRYLAVALVLIVAFMVAEVVVAALASSLALLADAGHMLADVGALGTSIGAARLAARPARGRWTFGWKRAEVLSAAINGITLVVVAALVIFEAVRRLISPGPVDGQAVLIVALVGVAVNLAASTVLSRADRSSLNVEGSFRHILTDLYGFVATAVAGVVILVTGFDRADAIASLVVVALMARAAWGLLGSAGRVLLEAAPEGVDLDEVRTHLLSGPHVLDVHDLHVWTVTSALPALSAHVVVDGGCFVDGHAPQILDELQACVSGHFDVEHSTFQLEPEGHAPHEFETHR